MVFIVDVLSKVVEGVSQKLTPQLIQYDPNILGVHYQHGHPKEVISNIADLGKALSSKMKRFPMIALFQDFPEQMLGNGFYADVRLHLIIARSTDPSYKADKRYEKNFKPVLYPVYEEFINQIRLCRDIDRPKGDNYPHTKIDRLYWGREGLYGSEANIMDDHLDCIEIRDLELRIKNPKC